MKKRIVSGIKPSGDMTIGNYIGAIKQFVDLQNSGQYESFIFVADLHAITVPQDVSDLRRRIYDIIKLYMAAGLDAEKTTLFLQSEVSAHASLGWVMTCHSYMGELERMTQYKDIVSKNQLKNQPIGAGVLAYPPLMAADILLYNPDFVPVGDDQSQHLEITRTLANRLNSQHKKDIFKMPETLVTEAGARIMSLQEPTKKMSKSDENQKAFIALLDDPKKAAKKVKQAVTDSDDKIYFDKENKPGISNLLTIYSSFTNTSMKDTEEKFKDARYGDFKVAVSIVVEEFLTSLQNRFNSISNEDVDAILDRGRIEASLVADKKLQEVYHELGLGRF